MYPVLNMKSEFLLMSIWYSYTYWYTLFHYQHNNNSFALLVKQSCMIFFIIFPKLK